MWTRLSKIVRATNLSAGIYRQISWKDISLHFLYWPIVLNLSKLACIFPDCLKDANITPSFKKEDPLDKKNYLPDSILPLLLKTIKKLIYKQLSNYVESILSSILYGFRKAHNTQVTQVIQVTSFLAKKVRTKRIWWYNFNGLIKSKWLYATRSSNSQIRTFRNW